MLRWLLYRLGRRKLDKDPVFTMQMAAEMSDVAMNLLKVQFDCAECAPDDIPHYKEFFVAAYIAGFCDVLAQSIGAKAGGNLSMSLSARLMQKIFGNTHGDYMWNKVDQSMKSRDLTCLQAMVLGGNEANSFLQKKAPQFKLAEYLSR